jgi:transposase
VDTEIGARHAPSEVSRLAKKRRSYTKDFKVEAVRLVVDQDRTIADVAKNLGIAESVLSQWKRQLGKLTTEAFRGNGHRTAHDEEVWRLKRELRQVTEERDILKKALAYFAKEAR